MRPAHLHLFCRKGPYSGLQVEFAPFSVTKLSGANESQREQQHGITGWSIAVVTVDRAQQRTDRFRLDNCRTVLGLWSHKCTAQVLCWIAISTAGGNREPEYHSATASQAACGLITASRFDSTQRN